MSTCKDCHFWGSEKDVIPPVGWRTCTQPNAVASMWENSKVRKDFGCIWFKKRDDWADKAAAEWCLPYNFQERGDHTETVENLAAIIRKHAPSRTNEELKEGEENA